MNAEELDQKLRDLPPNEPSPPCPAHLRPPTAPVGATTAQALAALRALPAPAVAAEHAARRARLRQIAEARAELGPRIRSLPLLGELRRLDTRCALLLGPSGVGKTAAAHWAKARHGGSWVHARDLGACERRHGLGQGTPPLLDRALQARVLYVDDLGAEDSADIGVLQYAIDARYAAGRATFVTSGLTADALSAYLGAPYVRRLLEQHVQRADGSEWPVLFFDAHGAGPR